MNFISTMEKHREVALYLMPSRIRALVYVLLKTVLSDKTLNNIVPNKNISGIGMSDSNNLASNYQKNVITKHFTTPTPYSIFIMIIMYPIIII